MEIYPKNLRTREKILVVLIFITISPLLLSWVLIDTLWGIILQIVIWLTWRERFMLFVYSNSPIWKDSIEAEVLPKIRNHAVILNWSERKMWKTSLSAIAFRHFRGSQNFNPIALIFRPFHVVKDYRFFEAFKEFKHGNPNEVEKITKDLFDNIGV
ncbi:MAG: hypothetical protein L0287_03730 [Anaerolineae bacterium]|nr:hypothetical protein [Anaerolineae bacterium]